MVQVRNIPLVAQLQWKCLLHLQLIKLSSDDKLVPEFENSHTQDQVPEDLNLESQFRLVYRASAAHVPKESLS